MTLLAASEILNPFSQSEPAQIGFKNLLYLTVWETLHSQLNNWIFLLTVALWFCAVCLCYNVLCTIQRWAATCNKPFIHSSSKICIKFCCFICCRYVNECHSGPVSCPRIHQTFLWMRRVPAELPPWCRSHGRRSTHRPRRRYVSLAISQQGQLPSPPWRDRRPKTSKGPVSQCGPMFCLSFDFGEWICRVEWGSCLPVSAGISVLFYTVKHYFFRCILISWFSYVENLLHVNLADFYYRNSCRIIVCMLQRILHIISHKLCYSINLWWWAIPKICVYLISRF